EQFVLALTDEPGSLALDSLRVNRSDLRGRNLVLLSHPDADPVVLPRVDAGRVRRASALRADADVRHGLHLPHEHDDGERLHNERGLYEVPAQALVRLEARGLLFVSEEV